MRKPGPNATASRPCRVVAAVALGAALVVAWPWFSQWWVSVLEGVGSAMAGRSSGGIVAPSTASPAIPVVIALLPLFSLGWRQKVVMAAGLALTTLLAEALVVAAGAVVHLSPGAVNMLVSIPVGVPFLWLLAAVLSTRANQ